MVGGCEKTIVFFCNYFGYIILVNLDFVYVFECSVTLRYYTISDIVNNNAQYQNKHFLKLFLEHYHNFVKKFSSNTVLTQCIGYVFPNSAYNQKIDI